MVYVPLDLKRQEVWLLVQIVCTLDVSSKEFSFLSRYPFHCFIHQKMSSPHSNLFFQFSNCFVCSCSTCSTSIVLTHYLIQLQVDL